MGNQYWGGVVNELGGGDSDHSANYDFMHSELHWCLSM